MSKVEVRTQEMRRLDPEFDDHYPAAQLLQAFQPMPRETKPKVHYPGVALEKPFTSCRITDLRCGGVYLRCGVSKARATSLPTGPRASRNEMTYPRNDGEKPALVNKTFDCVGSTEFPRDNAGKGRRR